MDASHHSVDTVARILADLSALHHIMAEELVSAAARAIQERGVFRLALAGGSTPRPFYELLATEPWASRMDWSRTEIFFSDERMVPADHSDSNYGMVQQALLSRVAVSAERVHRLCGEIEPEVAALRAEAALRRSFRSAAIPRLDLVLLGMGSNGHVASLFPGTAALREERRLVVAQYVEVQKQWRVTQTLPLINAAEQVWLLVTGASKAAAVSNVLQGEWQPEVLPAQYLAPERGRLTWWLDQAAAAQLDQAATTTASRQSQVRFT